MTVINEVNQAVPQQRNIRIKFEVGKTYSLGLHEPRLCSYVDIEGWGFYVSMGRNPKLMPMCPTSFFWKEYIPPRTKEVWVWAYWSEEEVVSGIALTEAVARGPSFRGLPMSFIKKITITEGEIEPPQSP